MRILIGFTIITLIITLVASITLQHGYALASYYTYDLDSKPYGQTYHQLASKWQQWHISVPSSQHPRENYSPDNCAVLQRGPVWFLADGAPVRADPSKAEERECVIPSNTSIIVQVLGGECDYGTEKTDSEVIACVNEGIDKGRVSAFIDGEEITELKNSRIGPYWFNISIPEDNIYQAEPGTFRAAVDGYFLFIKPLSPGNHTLEIKGQNIPMGASFGGPPVGSFHDMHVIYKLTIK